jgi:hypothetical protein
MVGTTCEADGVVDVMFCRRLALGFGVHQSFAIVCSHYANIDLVAMSQVYAPSYTKAQLDEIKKVVASPT